MTRQSIKKLKKIWEKKLVESGFEDHEVELRNGTRLLKWWSSVDSPIDENLYNHKYDEFADKVKRTKEYYRLAGHFLYDYKFKNATEKMIWKLHSEGLAYRKISELLNREKLGKTTILIKIRKLQVELKKFYSL